MSRSLTVFCKTITEPEHNANFEFNTKDQTWQLFQNKVVMMKTTKGTYQYIGMGQNQLCVLLKLDGKTRVGDIRGGFIAETAQEGETGTGHADETGISYNWTAGKAIET
ncbi:MAG: hypothetical protein ACXWC2_14395 [Ramlibacter sp.]